MSEGLKVSKEGSYGLVEQFRVLAKRVALPDLNFHRISYEEGSGYEFILRNPWYTTIPVSTVTSIELNINGYTVDEGQILFVIREQAIPFAYAKNLYELMWSMGECAQIRIMDPKLEQILEGRNAMELKFEIRTAFIGYHLPNNRIQYIFNEEMGVK